MNLNEWQTKVREQLQSSAGWLRKATPGMAYGALATCSILPLVMAVKGGDYSVYTTLGQMVGDLGLALIAGQVDKWRQSDEEQITQALTAAATDNAQWRTTLDQILNKLETPKLAQAVLAQADWDQLATLLRQEVQQLHSDLIISGDWVAGDKVAGDKMGGDKVLGHKAERDLILIENLSITSADPRQPTLRSNHYFHRLRTHCHAIPLTAMGGEATAGDEVTLDKLYIALDTTTTVPLTAAEKAAREKANPQRNRRDEDERIVTALEATQQTRRLVLLGHPGGGKSTFVHQLLAQAASVWLAAEDNAAQGQPGPFPLLTVLRDLTPRLQALPLADLTPSQQQKALCDTLLAQWHVDLHNFGGDEHQATLAQALLTGELLLVFDGLDEMPATVRPLVRAALVALTKAYPKLAQLIVTCRIRSYHGEAVLPGFQAYTLADFDEAKIQAFVAGWYQAQLQLGRLQPEQAKTQREDLQRAARQRDLRRMAVNPLLLTTMALIHQKQKRLPDQRVELYDEAVDVLLYRWQQERANPNSAELTAFLKSNKVRPLLERLAYAAHQPPKQAPPRRGTRQQPTDESTDLTRSELLALLDEALQGQMGLAAEFLDYVDLRAGLLVGRGGDESGSRPALYAFAHRTFQEYLAGCWLLAGRERKHNFWAHAAEGDYWQLAAQLGAEELLYNRRDEQGLLDLMYYLCPVHAPRNKQDRRAALWSAQMAALLERQTIAADSFADGGTAYLDRLRKRLVAILTGNQLPALERAEAGRVLAKLGDPRSEVTTIDQMEFCFVPAGPFVMGSKKGNGPGEDPLAYEDEEPQHTFDIAHDYWLARYPLTNAQYDRFVKADGYANPAYWTEAATHGYWQDGRFQDRNQPDQYGEPFDLPNHPVVGISWYEALAYGRWLTERLPAGWQARLPSEAEWEKGARGGLQIPAQPLIAALAKVTVTLQSDCHLINNRNPARRYAWDDQIEAEKLNYNETNIGSTSAVGAFPGGVSPYGAEEMNGNVLEWCSTIGYADYAEYAQQVDNSLHENSRRVLRGGSFGGYDDGARASCRNWDLPGYRLISVGVRFLLSPSLL